MPSIRTLTVLLAALATATPSFAADPYEPDNTASLFEAVAIHGPRQSRDLEGTGDVDYVVVDVAPRRSYEASVDTAGYFTAELTRRGAGNVLQQTGSGVAINSTRSATGILSSWSSHSSSVLNWIESGDHADRTRFLRIDANGAVHTAADSQYTLQLRETTLYCPRYNNTGGQATVLVVQRVGVQESGENTNGCVWTADFYDQAYNVFGHPLNGSFTGSPSFSSSLAQNGMFVVATPAVAPGSSGSIQIAHTCGYGRVQAKAVSLEPATGFTFDTTCSTRPE
ncbi:MAG: hypothetical protein ABW221_05175 [Vicinamibacteria bacterium]